MSKADEILDAAERMLKQGGYHGFSFRDVAAAVGIKSASVHHHFATKPDLVVAVAERGAEAVWRAIDVDPGPARVAALRAAFRRSLGQEGNMCLFGMIGAEAGGLPEPVVAAAGRFFRTIAERLAEGLPGTRGEAEAEAITILARLEGAMILARTLKDPELFDRATEGIAHERG